MSHNLIPNGVTYDAQTIGGGLMDGLLIFEMMLVSFTHANAFSTAPYRRKKKLEQVVSNSKLSTDVASSSSVDISMLLEADRHAKKVVKGKSNAPKKTFAQRLAEKKAKRAAILQKAKAAAASVAKSTLPNPKPSAAIKAKREAKANRIKKRRGRKGRKGKKGKKVAAAANKAGKPSSRRSRAASAHLKAALSHRRAARFHRHTAQAYLRLVREKKKAQKLHIESLKATVQANKAHNRAQ